jgi:transposase
LNEEKIQKDGKWDGLHGVITNIDDLKPEEILAQYKGLWQIEETFRISKLDLQVRPIYHWTPRRVKAHIAIAFMALTCIRNLN